MSHLKSVLGVYPSRSTHWVGDGFPVRNLIPSNDFGENISPFLMLDYAGPRDFEPTDQPRGVDEHPHRGFETVTIVYQGALEHRDSGGNSGTIAEGDVQWMTAASGVVHEEKHEREFAKQGGVMEMIQLWVNLPREVKMSPPRYQTLLKAQIPVVELPDDAGSVRIIAGTFAGVSGPAHTFTPVNLWDARLKAGHRAEFTFTGGYTTALFLLRGKVKVNETDTAGEAELVLLAQEGENVVVEAQEDTTLLVLNGQPIREPVARYGPFVMNTQEELVQAVNDYRAGKMGHLR